jgi:hypothetical protein
MVLYGWNDRIFERERRGFGIRKGRFADSLGLPHHSGFGPEVARSLPIPPEAVVRKGPAIAVLGCHRVDDLRQRGPVDAAAIVENAPGSLPETANILVGVSHNRLENASRFPQRPQVELDLPRQETNKTNNKEEGFDSVEAVENARPSFLVALSRDSETITSGQRALAAFPTASIKNQSSWSQE